MATFGYIIEDVDAAQISQIMDMAGKKVNENQQPINVSLSLSLKEKADKTNIIKSLLEELKQQNLWGKVDISFPETKFSSDEIRQITAEMSKYKDKAVNFSFDSIANNFSKEDTAEILRACNNSMSTTYPFTAMARDGIPDALREKFLENNPNIIYTGGSNPNFTKLKNLLGLESNDIRGEIISNADKRHMSAAQYARYLVSTLDTNRLNEIKKYTSALDRLAVEYNPLTLANLKKNGYDDVNVFFKTVKSSMEEKIQSQEKTNSTEQILQLDRKNLRSFKYIEFKDFHNFYNGISSLYEKDGKQFLYLSSHDKLTKCCIELNKEQPLTEQLSLLACNLQAFQGHLLTAAKTQPLSVNNERIPLIQYNNIEFISNNHREKLLPFPEIIKKIKQTEMDGYLACIVFKNQFKTTINKEQFDILQYYKTEGYEFINSFLRNGPVKTRGSEKITPEFCRKLMLLDKAFDDNPPLTEDLTVYRGSKNRETEHSSFISSSLSKQVAVENFSAGQIYEIHLPKGTHVLFLDNIDGLRKSEVPPEAEILLRPADFLYIGSQNNQHQVKLKEKNFSQLLLSALERRKEEFLKNKSPDEIKQYLNAIEYVRKEINTTQSAENKASRDTNSQTANGKQTPSSEMDLEKYSKILESQNIPAATLWEAAKTMEKNDPEGRYTSYAVTEVVNRDPKFNPHEMLAKINEDVTMGYSETDGGKPDEITEIGNYGAAAHAVEQLVANNSGISNFMALITLSKISKNLLEYKASENTELQNAQRTAIMQTISAYQQCSYPTPSLAITAINNIRQLSKVGKLPGVIYDTLGTINAVHAIFNKSKPNKDIAKASLMALKDTTPLVSVEAEKMLSVYRKIGMENPEMGDMVAMNILKTFKQCSEENIKKECLKTLTNLNTFRGHFFDKDTQQKINQFSQYMKRQMNINAGKPTNTPNPQSRTGR